MEEFRDATQPYCGSGCGCYEDGVPGHEGQCVTKCNTLEEQRAWLRSSMASLLCYMAERMPKKLEKHQGPKKCGEREAMFIGGVNSALDDCRTLLIEEARRISEV